MKTIGKLLKDARAKKRYSLARLEKETKIKKEFIEAIEKENWKALPEYPVVVGFVKNIAEFLGTNQGAAVALLRRDYPPQKLRINPKPDVSKQFVWSPRLTFLVGVVSVVVLILGYLGLQYFRFVSAPHLEVFEPQDGQEITTSTLAISGKTDQDATLKVNNQPILVDAEGGFSGELKIAETTTEVTFEATSRAGKTTTVRRIIKPELNQ
jgi:cytoskeletal protein RodZ